MMAGRKGVQNLTTMVIELLLAEMILKLVGVMPFPSDMYHTRDPDGFQDLLRDQGYKVRELPSQKTTKTALADLMPWDCGAQTHMQIHNMRDFGKVAVKGRTYTEAHQPGGKYYATVDDYDRTCACPPLYEAMWEPFRGTQRILSPEIRTGHLAVETTRISVKSKPKYIIFFKVSNKIVHQGSGRIIVAGGAKAERKDMLLRNYKDQLLFMPPFANNVRKSLKKLGLTPPRHPKSYESIIDRLYSRTLPNRYLKLMAADVQTQLLMVDYIVNVLYEKYLWVEWTVNAIDATDVGETWRRRNRTLPCQISDTENWGIEYSLEAESDVRVCDFHEYSLTYNANRTGFTMFFPLGKFEPFGPSPVSGFELARQNKTVTWTVTEPAIAPLVLLKVTFAHGERRRSFSKIWSMMEWNRGFNHFHMTFLTPPHWQLHRTTIVDHRQDMMCDRNTYLEKIRTLNITDEPQEPEDKYQLLRVLYHTHPDKCEVIYGEGTECNKPVEHGYCRRATGPLEVAVQRHHVLPDVHNNASVLAYGQPCFLHSNYTLRALSEVGTILPDRKRFFFALLFSAIMGAVVENSLKSALDEQMDKYNEILNRRLGGLTQEMNDGFNHIEGQIIEVHDQQMKLQHELSLLARYTVDLAGRESAFENQQIAIDRQLIQGQVDNARAILENKQLALHAGQASAQAAILNYHLHKRLILLLEHLNAVPGLKNSTIYRHDIRKGLIESQELYWFGKNLTEFLKYQNETKAIRDVQRNL